MDRTPAQSTRSKSAIKEAPSDTDNATPGTERKRYRSENVSKARKNLFPDCPGEEKAKKPAVKRSLSNPWSFSDLDESPTKAPHEQKGKSKDICVETSAKKTTPGKKARTSNRKRGKGKQDPHDFEDLVDTPGKESQSEGEICNPDTDTEVSEASPVKVTPAKNIRKRGGKSPCKTSVITKKNTANVKRTKSVQTDTNSDTSEESPLKVQDVKEKVLRFKPDSTKASPLKGILKTPQKTPEGKKETKVKKRRTRGSRASQSSLMSSQSSINATVEEECHYEWMLDEYVFQKQQGNLVGTFLKGKEFFLLI